MRLMHRFAVGETAAAELVLLGVNVGEISHGYAVLHVDESDPIWPVIAAWTVTHPVVDIAYTKFTARELDGASWLALHSDWHHGYPLPSGAFEYLSLTFDGGSCGRCGIGRRQVAPIRMKGEPKWGKRNILQLHWLYDEFFVTPDVWAQVFEPFGVAARPVVNRRGAVLETVVQLVVGVAVDVETDGLEYSVCEECGERKFSDVRRGYSPEPLQPIECAPVSWSRQWFGSGGKAYRQVIVSQELRRAFAAAGVKGATPRPCGPLLLS